MLSFPFHRSAITMSSTLSSQHTFAQNRDMILLPLSYPQPVQAPNNPVFSMSILFSVVNYRAKVFLSSDTSEVDLCIPMLNGAISHSAPSQRSSSSIQARMDLMYTIISDKSEKKSRGIARYHVPRLYVYPMTLLCPLERRP